MFRLPHSFICRHTEIGTLGLAAALLLFPSPSAASGGLSGLNMATDQKLTAAAEYKGQRVITVYRGLAMQRERLASFPNSSSSEVTELTSKALTTEDEGREISKELLVAEAEGVRVSPERPEIKDRERPAVVPQRGSAKKKRERPAKRGSRGTIG